MLQNSWGTSWGLDGFFYIARGVDEYVFDTQGEYSWTYNACIMHHERMHELFTSSSVITKPDLMSDDANWCICYLYYFYQ